MFIVLFVSCEQKEFGSKFDKAVIYEYGYSYMGLTYEIPVKFYFNNKEIASFYLFSFDKYLESGVYNYTDVVVGTWHAFPESCYSNKTFFKGRCKWGDNIVTGGTIIVERRGEEHIITVDVVDNTGEQHYAVFSGKVHKENWHTKSEIGGIFCSAVFWEGWEQPADENYKGVIMQMDAGDIYNNLRVSLGFLLNKNSDITGTYHINPNAKGYISSAVDGVYQNTCGYKNYPVEGHTLQYSVDTGLVSGTIIISRVNEQWRYRIDVDVVAKNGFEIKGCFNGGEICLFGNTIHW